MSTYMPAVTRGAAVSLSRRDDNTPVATSRPRLTMRAAAIVGTESTVITALGLIAIVGPLLLQGAAILARRRERVRAPRSLREGRWRGSRADRQGGGRSGSPAGTARVLRRQSYPSAHDANSVGWLAIAIAIPGRRSPGLRGRRRRTARRAQRPEPNLPARPLCLRRARRRGGCGRDVRTRRGRLARLAVRSARGTHRPR
jgi:hypothetical protein